MVISLKERNTSCGVCTSYKLFNLFMWRHLICRMEVAKVSNACQVFTRCLSHSEQSVSVSNYCHLSRELRTVFLLQAIQFDVYLEPGCFCNVCIFFHRAILFSSAMLSEQALCAILHHVLCGSREDFIDWELFAGWLTGKVFSRINHMWFFAHLCLHRERKPVPL